MKGVHEPFDFHETGLDEQLEQLEHHTPLAENRPDVRTYASLKALYAPVNRHEEQGIARVYQRLATRATNLHTQEREPALWIPAPTEQPTMPLPLPRQHKAKVHAWLRYLAAVLIVGVLLGGFLGLLNFRALGTQPLKPTSTPQKTGPWHLVPMPQLSATSTALSAITVLSAHDAWAVGAVTSGVGYPVTLHWDGKGWMNLQEASTAPTGELAAVAALGSNDIWAVGSRDQGRQTLIEHWNGQQWKVITSPDLSKESASLSGIAALTPNNIWAVGEYSSGNDFAHHALIEHWNGSQWTVIASPSIGVAQELTKITALSATDIWAIGIFSSSNIQLGTYRPLIEHWNGQTWQVASSPDPISSFNQGSSSALSSISASSPTDIWAVGNIRRSGGALPQTLVEHWNGQQWALMQSPNPDPGSDESLLAVTALAPNNAWASMFSGGLLLHWNGQQWQIVSSASLPQGCAMSVALSLALDPSAPGALWLAGYCVLRSSKDSMLIETNRP